MAQNKNGIIFSVANKRTIAWATLWALRGAGAASLHLQECAAQGRRREPDAENSAAVGQWCRR